MSSAINSDAKKATQISPDFKDSKGNSLKKSKSKTKSSQARVGKSNPNKAKGGKRR